MIANQPYNPASLVRFQMSILSLEAVLRESALVGAIEEPAEAVEVELLKSLIEPRDRY